jgi:hypothetical protein
MFSYIAAWSYFGVERDAEPNLHIDNFNSRQTHAWDELINKAKPKIFPHGDECNPYIMIADIIAYLTDAKLYNQKLGLKRENLQKIWEDYGFQVDTHFLDINTQPAYKWHSEDPIDTTPYLAHPLVFLLVDELEKLQPNPPPATEEEDKPMSEGPPIANPKEKTEEQRFKKLVRHMEPWYATAAYAYHKGGAAQLFNYHIDRTKVQDGDVMVYIGNKSKELAESFSHMYDVEILSAKEIRKFVNTPKKA